MLAQFFIDNHTETNMIALNIAAIIPVDPPILNMLIIDDNTSATLANPLMKPTINALILVTPFIIGYVIFAEKYKRKSHCWLTSLLMTIVRPL